jgi:hypothetical protein
MTKTTAWRSRRSRSEEALVETSVRNWLEPETTGH